MKKFIYFNISLLISNLIFLVFMSLLFKDKIAFEFHIDPKIIYLSLILFILSILAVSKTISYVFNENIKKIFLKTSLGLLISIFSLNIYSLLHFLYQLVQQQDIMFSCKLFKIHYVYSKEELFKYINNYYNELTGKTLILPLKVKHEILDKATTIAESKLNVENYVNLEANSWWGKLSSFSTTLYEFCLQHPYLSSFLITSIATCVAYPLWILIKDTINILKVVKDVESLNNRVLNVETKSANSSGLISNIFDHLCDIYKTNSVIYPIFHDFLVLTGGVIGSDNQKEIYRYKSLVFEMVDKLFSLLSDNDEKIKKIEDSRSQFQPFSGEGHRLGES